MPVVRIILTYSCKTLPVIQLLTGITQAQSIKIEWKLIDSVNINYQLLSAIHVIIDNNQIHRKIHL